MRPKIKGVPKLFLSFCILDSFMELLFYKKYINTAVFIKPISEIKNDIKRSFLLSPAEKASPIPEAKKRLNPINRMWR
jgi:hypothetical protein